MRMCSPLPLCLALLAWLCLTSAKTVCVRDSSCEQQFSTIQEAVNACDPHDVVLVVNGQYAESITIRAQPLSIISAAGSAHTTVLSTNAPARERASALSPLLASRFLVATLQ
jgi:pectin methylesterase-like acyl-CoA thioesterase